MLRYVLSLLVVFLIPTPNEYPALNIAHAAHQQTIAYIGFSTDKPFWVNLGNAIRNEASRRNVNLIDLTPPSPDDAIQAKLLSHAIDKQVAGIIVGAGNPAVLHPALTLAHQEGIPVIAVDTAIHHPAIKALIATDNAKGAEMAGDFIVTRTGGKGSVLILGGTAHHPNGEARRLGVTRKAEQFGMQVIFRRADWDDEKAFLATSEELSKDNDIRAIFACWDPGIDTASLVVAKKELQEKLVLVGFDGLERTLNFIREGRVTATVAQDTETMGATGVQALLAVIEGKDFASSILIPPLLVDKYSLPAADD